MIANFTLYPMIFVRANNLDYLDSMLDITISDRPGSMNGSIVIPVNCLKDFLSHSPAFANDLMMRIMQVKASSNIDKAMETQFKALGYRFSWSLSNLPEASDKIRQVFEIFKAAIRAFEANDPSFVPKISTFDQFKERVSKKVINFESFFNFNIEVLEDKRDEFYRNFYNSIVRNKILNKNTLIELIKQSDPSLSVSIKRLDSSHFPSKIKGEANYFRIQINETIKLCVLTPTTEMFHFEEPGHLTENAASESSDMSCGEENTDLEELEYAVVTQCSIEDCTPDDILDL